MLRSSSSRTSANQNQLPPAEGRRMIPLKYSDQNHVKQLEITFKIMMQYNLQSVQTQLALRSTDFSCKHNNNSTSPPY